MGKWHNTKKELPTKEKQYLCCKLILNTPHFFVYMWSNNLYEVDPYDFPEHKNIRGFYDYDSEWGYCERGCAYWQEIEFEVNK